MSNLNINIGSGNYKVTVDPATGEKSFTISGEVDIPVKGVGGKADVSVTLTQDQYNQITGASGSVGVGKIQGKWELAFAEWGNKAIEEGNVSFIRSFSLLAQRKRTKRNGTPMSIDGFSKAFSLGEGQLTKANLAQTVPHLYRSNTHKISSPPIGGKACILKVA